MKWEDGAMAAVVKLCRTANRTVISPFCSTRACRHSYGGVFPGTDENSKTIATLMKTCCNRAMPTGGTHCSLSSPSLSAAVSCGRKRIGNDFKTCTICLLCEFLCVCVCVGNGVFILLIKKYACEVHPKKTLDDIL